MPCNASGGMRVSPLLGLFLCLVLPARAAQEPPPASIDHDRVPAAGRHVATARVEAFGRYSIQAASGQGVALQAVDRMAGAGPVFGEAGRQDGRIDLFLDRGEQRVVVLGAERASGNAALSIRPFRELHEHPPLLIEERLEATSLGDLEQRSYWIDVPKVRTVAIEAAGRNLADLRLWKDGTWLVDAAPALTVGTARPEQPLAVARLVATLNPGLYLVTAYGGAGQAWTQKSEDRPFYLRMGLTTLAPAGRQQFTAGEFGVERFVVPAGASHFRLELASSQPARLQVGPFDPSGPYNPQGASADIDKRSLLPVAQVDDIAEGAHLVTVTLAPGQTFTLQYFDARGVYRFRGSGDFWVSSIHDGSPADLPGVTAVMTRLSPGSAEQYFAEQALEIPADAVWRRRFNLLEELTMIVKIPEASHVKIRTEGTSARFRFEPFLGRASIASFENTIPSSHGSGDEVDLDAGLHVLHLLPQSPGIVDLRLERRSTAILDASRLRKLVAPDTPTPVAAAARFFPIHLEAGSDYALYLNAQPGSRAGAVVRPLPIDLSAPLYVAQRADESLVIPVSVPERGSLRAVAEDGKTVPIALEDGRKGESLDVEAGRYQVTIPASGSPLGYSLRLDPQRLERNRPLPELPPARIAGLPSFPELTPEAPRFLDLGRSAHQTYRVKVDRPGFFEIESTGLLQTEGAVRTRTNPSLFEDKSGGVGRNFHIGRYLREGEYQLTVATAGRTKGHLGVRIARTEEIDGGELREGDLARALLPAGRTLSYRFRIASRGPYRLHAMGLGHDFDVRLEDGEGWPVAEPVAAGDITREFEPGTYRVLLQAQTTDARVLTQVERIPDPVRREGHGPHRLEPDVAVEHLWKEPEAGKARTPDRWDFVLPAPAQVGVTLDNEMEGEIVAAGEPGKVLARVLPNTPWQGNLPAGSWSVLARHSRHNNLVQYTVRYGTTELLAGQAREIIAPAVIPVAVDGDGVVEFESFGAHDVRARLLDESGATVAQNDDRDNDWNFEIAQRLRPGRYQLQVDPVGEERAPTRVALNAIAEVDEGTLEAGRELGIGDAKSHMVAISPAPGSNALVVSARSEGAVGIAIERRLASGWVGVGSRTGVSPVLVVPLRAQAAGAIRVRAWSADRRSTRFTLRTLSASLPGSSEEELRRGQVRWMAIDSQRPEVRIGLVSLVRAGAFALHFEGPAPLWSDDPARAAASAPGGVIAVGAGELLLYAPAGAGSSISAERVAVPSGTAEALRVELAPAQRASLDLAPGTSSALVVASSRSGQPGIALGPRVDAAAMGFVPGESATYIAAGVAAGGEQAVRLWNASESSAPFEASVREVLLEDRRGEALALGSGSGELGPHSALARSLPPGGVRARLTLAAQGAAVFLRKGSVVSTHWAGDSGLQETISVNADEVRILNADARPSQYSVELAPGSADPEAPLAPGGLLERNLATSGRLRVPVEIPDGEGSYRLRVRGDAQALWQDASGRIQGGNDFDVRSAGTLWLLHEPGTVVAWLDEPRASGWDRVSRWLGSLSESSVRPPESVPLQGKQQVLLVRLERPSLLHVRTSAPVVAQFLGRGRPGVTQAFLHGAMLNIPAPAGESRLVLRAIGSESLSGHASVFATEVTNLVEGEGPAVLLGPGGARLFSFTLDRPDTIGIGVRASSDVVSSVLYDEQGAVQSQGVVQMPRLAAGRYYLAIEAPESSAPVRARAIVLGLARADTRPPYEVLRRYVEAQGDATALLYDPRLEAEREAQAQAAALAAAQGSPDGGEAAPPTAPAEGAEGQNPEGKE